MTYAFYVAQTWAQNCHVLEKKWARKMFFFSKYVSDKVFVYVEAHIRQNKNKKKKKRT